MSRPTETPSPYAVPEREAARLLGVSLRYLQEGRYHGYGPPYVRFGRAIRYPLAPLREWMDQQYAGPTQQAG